MLESYFQTFEFSRLTPERSIRSTLEQEPAAPMITNGSILLLSQASYRPIPTWPGTGSSRLTWPIGPAIYLEEFILRWTHPQPLLPQLRRRAPRSLLPSTGLSRVYLRIHRDGWPHEIIIGRWIKPASTTLLQAFSTQTDHRWR